MSDSLQGPPNAEMLFAKQVAAKAVRKLQAQSRGPGDVWFGLGMMGLIGWSIAVPTVVGALVGLWLDRHHLGAHSWTLALLIAGLCIGCANVWRWINEQSHALQDDAGAPR